MSSTLNDRLISAIRRGRLDDVLLLLENGANPRYREKGIDEMTTVHIAVRHNQPSCLRALLILKAKHNVRIGKNSTSPLNYAAQLGHIDCLQVLLAAGADYNSVDSLGCTPIMFAAEHGYGDAVYLLLKAGADPSRRDRNGWTPLLLACRLGHENAVRWLLEVGKVDPDVTDENGRTPLMICCLREDGDEWKYGLCVQHLAKANAEIEKLDRRGWNIFHYIMKNGCHAAAKHLCVAAKGVNTEMDVVAYAAKFGRLIQQAEPEEGWTPLHIGAVHGRSRSHALAFKVLTTAGADYNCKDRRGRTPLTLAKLHGTSAIVRQLVCLMQQNGVLAPGNYLKNDKTNQRDQNEIRLRDLELAYANALADASIWKEKARVAEGVILDVRSEWELSRQDLQRQLVALRTGGGKPESSGDEEDDFEVVH